MQVVKQQILLKHKKNKRDGATRPHYSWVMRDEERNRERLLLSKVNRLNELYGKQNTLQGLTRNEMEEQGLLRSAFLSLMKERLNEAEKK